MKSQVLIIVESDPRTSPRPAEAIRIAAGLAAWEKVDPVIYLRGPALLVLGAAVDDLVDGDSFLTHFPSLAERRAKIYARQDDPLPEPRSDAAPPMARINDRQLAGVAAASRCVTRF